MNKRSITTLIFFLAVTAAFAAVHPAALTVQNNGARPLAVKLM